MREERDYTRLLAYRGRIEFEKGMRGEQDKKTALTTLYRHRQAIMALVGGKCRETGSVHYPPSRLGYDPQSTSIDTQIGRAHVCTPVTNAHLVCRLLLEKKNTK